MKLTAWWSFSLVSLVLTSGSGMSGVSQSQPLSKDNQQFEGQLVVATGSDCTQLDRFFSELLTLTNQARHDHDLPPLTFSYQLGQAAQGYAEDLATQNFFSHTGKDGSTITSRIQATGYRYSSAGENLAAGQISAQSVFQGWMNSQGHRANILNDQFTEVGFGLFDSTGNSDFGLYWVQNFGKPQGRSTQAEAYIPASCGSVLSANPVPL